MPIELANAPATLMRLMTIVFSGMLYTTYLADFDDIIAFGRNYIEMLGRLETALERYGQANLKLKLSKYAFGKTSVNFFGHVIYDKGISTDQEKMRRLQECPRPHNQNKARIFLVYAIYYRKFIRNFAHIVKLLNNLRQIGHQFYWSADCESSFITIKFTKPFIVDCNASDFGIGNVLSQAIRSGVEQPISYFSRTLSKPDKNTQ